MAVNPQELDRPWLRKILEQSFFHNPRLLQQNYDFEPSPIGTMLGDSPLLDYIRQALPNRVSDTKVGSWLQRKAQNLEPDTIRSGVVDAIRNAPLGGFPAEELARRQRLRAEDEIVRRGTVQLGMIPTADGSAEIPVGDSARAAAAQAAGVTLGDAASDGLRNIWWFLNAPQAIASLAVLQAIHKPAQREAARLDGALSEQLGEFDRITTPFGNRRMRLAATLPAVIAASAAVGNIGRQAGYTAAIPSEADRKVAADPLAELGARYFLGRTGQLLSYEEFAKERPDVSKGEYDAYKAYLHGSPMPIKATLDGIHGPEVTFMGKSVPILTGVLPIAAAVMGARWGARRAMDRLRDNGDQLQAAERARLKYRELEQELRSPRYDDEGNRTSRPEAQIQRDLQQRKAEFSEIQRANEIEMLKHTLFGSAAYMTPTAIAGQTLELIRRGLPDGRTYEETPAPAPESEPKPRKQRPKMEEDEDDLLVDQVNIV